MVITEKESRLIEAYKNANAGVKLGIHKLLDVDEFIPEITKKDLYLDLILPPYPILKDIAFWLTANDDSFIKDGIEKGDLLGCCCTEDVTDEPISIHILQIPGESNFTLCKIDFKTDYGAPGAMLYLNSEFTKKQFVSEDDIFTEFKDLGKVKVVLKCKYLT